MKKYIFLLGLVIFSGVAVGFPLEVNFFKSNYVLGETINGEIFLNYSDLDISSSSLSLYRENSSVSFLPHLIKLSSGHYLFYFETKNLEEGEYSLFFEDFFYEFEGSSYQQDFNFNFNLVSSNSSVISIFPGALDVTNSFFFNLDIQRQGAEQLNVYLGSNLTFLDFSENNILLDELSEKVIEVYIGSNFQEVTGIQYIILEDGQLEYLLPLWFGNDQINLAYNESETTITEEASTEGLSFLADSINQTLEYGEGIFGGYLEIINPTNLTIDNFSLNFSNNLFEVVNFENESFGDIEPGEIKKVYLNLNPTGMTPSGNYTGNLTIFSENNLFDSLEIHITILEIIAQEEIIDSNNQTIDGFEDLIMDEEKEIINENLQNEGKAPSNFGVLFWISLFITLILLIIYFVYQKNKSKISLPS